MKKPPSVSKNKSTTFKLLTVGTFAAIGMVGLVQSAFALAPKDTLIIGKSADPQTLDPAVTIDNNDWTVTYPAYQKLVQYKVENGKSSTSVEGDLASSWKTSPDNLVWEFKLKKNQKFDDGKMVDAAAVKFSFDRLLDLKKGPSEAFPSDMQVTVVDPTTIRFTLKAPFAPFLSTLANNGAAIINPSVQQKAGGADAFLARNTAGSGPFRLVNWQKGQSLLLEPNQNYAGVKPSLKKVVVKIIPEASARRLELEKGDLDIAEDIPEDQLGALKGKSGIRVGEYPSLRVTYLYLNNKRPPLNNPEVRRAIVQAIDYKGIVGGILKGKAKQMKGPIPEGMWGHDSTIAPPSQNINVARALLAKSGQKNLNLSFVYSAKDPNWEPIGLTAQANLGMVGINLKMENLANATMRDRIGKGDFDIAIGNWSPDFSDPFMFMNYWFDSSKQGLPGNRSFYVNPKVDTLLRDAAVQTNQKERVKLYQQAQKIVVADAAYVYLYQKNYGVAMRDGVKGFMFNPMLEQVFNVGAMSK